MEYKVPEYTRRAIAKYHNENKDKIREKRKLYYLMNKELICEKRRQRYQLNKAMQQDNLISTAE